MHKRRRISSGQKIQIPRSGRQETDAGVRRLLVFSVKKYRCESAKILAETSDKMVKTLDRTRDNGRINRYTKYCPLILRVSILCALYFPCIFKLQF
ncbi:putative transcription factor [Trichinella spiralis]|uniref:Transcription factor n=1 Tax=Trichinella spiralis TaxID=6334 RepID=A0ABR3KG43_TRISP